jgi:hypothetical protein
MSRQAGVSHRRRNEAEKRRIPADRQARRAKFTNDLHNAWSALTGDVGISMTWSKSPIY